MSAAVIGLLVGAALAHAAWNILTKMTAGPALAVSWLVSLVSTLVVAPFAVVVILRGARLDGTVLLIAAISGAIHLAYFLVLRAGYRHGDLSLVYPIARGAAPLCAVAGAVVFLGERPSALLLLGVATIAAGVALTARGHGSRRALLLALATGALIAGYTVFDAAAVTRFAITPILVEWLNDALRVAALAPLVLRDRGGLIEMAKRSRWALLGVGVFSPIAYILVLFALRLAPVTVVAPLREASILIGVAWGGLLLRERRLSGRLSGAALVFAGIVLIALS